MPRGGALWKDYDTISAILGTLRSEAGVGVVRIEDRFDADIPLDLLFAYGAGELIHVEDLGNHLAGFERDTNQGRWAALEPAYRELAAKIG